MPTTPISPKVTAGINWGIIATLGVGVLTSVTPDMLSGLGPYQSMVFVLVGSATTALRAYLTADPLREAGLKAQTDTAAAPAVEPTAPAVSFAPTQAKIDAAAVTLPDVLQTPAATPAA